MFKKLRDFWDKLISVWYAIAFVVAIWAYFWGYRALRYFDNGYEYYKKGDWQSAIAEWKSASEIGRDALLPQAREAAHKAEFNLGLVYTKGEHGIVENY